MQWEIGYLALTAIDTVQTVDCFNRDLCEEVNPLMGRNPSTEKLIIGRVLLSGLHFAVFKHMLDRNPKAALRYSQISVGFEGSAVALNARFSF